MLTKQKGIDFVEIYLSGQGAPPNPRMQVWSAGGASAYCPPSRLVASTALPEGGPVREQAPLEQHQLRSIPGRNGVAMLVAPALLAS